MSRDANKKKCSIQSKQKLLSPFSGCEVFYELIRNGTVERNNVQRYQLFGFFILQIYACRDALRLGESCLLFCVLCSMDVNCLPLLCPEYWCEDNHEQSRGGHQQ